MKKLSNLLLLLGGYDPEIVAVLPMHYRIRYHSYGLAILITTTAAFLGMFHTGLSYFHNNAFLALLLAIIWTGFIAIIEHLIVVGTESHNKKIIAVTRGLASLVFSFIISTPLVLALCEGPVHERIKAGTQAEIGKQEAAFELWQSQGEQKIAAKEAAHIRARQQADSEAAGLGPSGKYGADGPITRRLDSTAKVLENQLASEKAGFERDLAQQRIKMDANKDIVNANVQNDDLTQFRVLIQLVKEDGAIRFRFVTLWLALLFIELLPLVLKLTKADSEDDPYDVVQQGIEIEQRMKRVQKENELFDFLTKIMLDESATEIAAIIEIDNQLQYITDPKVKRALQKKFNADFITANRRTLGAKHNDHKAVLDHNPTYFPPGYSILITDGNCIESPLLLSTAIANHALDICQAAVTDDERIETLFDFVCNQVMYDHQHDAFLWGYRNAMEAYVDKTAICGEISFLFIALARIVGLRAEFVEVDIDHQEVKVHHACALVNNQLVDVSYNLIDAKHKICRVLRDSEVEQRYKSWRIVDPS